MPRSLLLVLVVLLLSAPPARAATKPYAVESATAGQTLSDGDRYASWVHDGAIRVLDEQDGTTASFPLPAECRVPGAIGDGQLATICGKEFRLLDLATGGWTTVPPTDASTGLFNADSVGVDGLGKAWIAVTVETGYHAPTYPAWIERATGRLVVDDPGDLRQQADLNAPALWAPLCAPLKRRKNPYYDAFEQYGSPYAGPTVVGTLALDVAKGALVLRRCGSSKTHVITRSKRWESGWLGGARVSWIDQDGLRALDGDQRGRGLVRTFDARTGRVRSWPVPGKVNPNLRVVHTRQHLFLDKYSSDGKTGRYAIDLT